MLTVKTRENEREKKIPLNVPVSWSLSNKIIGQAIDHKVQKVCKISAYNRISLFITQLIIHCQVLSSSLMYSSSGFNYHSYLLPLLPLNLLWAFITKTRSIERIKKGKPTKNIWLEGQRLHVNKTYTLYKDLFRLLKDQLSSQYIFSSIFSPSNPYYKG